MCLAVVFYWRWWLQCWPASVFHCSNTSWADTASWAPIPATKNKCKQSAVHIAAFRLFLRTYRAIWTPSSSPWGQASPHLPHLQVLQTPLPENKKMGHEAGTQAWSSVKLQRTDPWEDDITRLCHRSLSTVDVHHRLLHQRVIQLTPVWPASSYCCSAWGGILLLITQHTNKSDFSKKKKKAFWKVILYLICGLRASPMPQTAPVLCFWSRSLWRLPPSLPPLQNWRP